MVEKTSNLKDKKEELACILFADAALKKAKLESIKNIYQDYVSGKLKYPYGGKDISKVASFIIENDNFKKIFIPSIAKEDNVDIDHTIKDDLVYIIPGKKLGSKEEYELFIKFLISTSNSLKNGEDKKFLLFGQEERKQLLSDKIDRLFDSWAKALFDFFVKSYNDLSNEREKILVYYELFENYFDDPTEDKYRDLISKISYIKSVSDSDLKKEIKLFINECENFKRNSTKPKEETKKQEVLITREQRIANYNLNNSKKYTDLEPISLNCEEEIILNEIYDFVCLLDEEEFKEFVANPLYFFSHLSEEQRYHIINNFIIKMEKDPTFKSKQTIAKRLNKR